MKKILYGTAAVLALAPLMASAQASLSSINTNIIGPIGDAIKLLIPIAFGLAVLFFFYGVALYILAAGDPKKASEGKSIMIYGVIALAVMASIWGLVAYLQQTLGVTGTPTSGQVTPPVVNGL